MKVLYDISILGRAHLDARSRTGIFRVVESVFAELSYHKDILLLPTALHEKSGFWDNYAAQLYLSDQKPTYEDSFVSFYPKKIPFYNARTSIQKYLVRDSQKNRSIVSRASRYGISRGCKLFDKVSGVDRISASIRPVINQSFYFESLNVYHSPFLSFPDTDFLPSKTKRVITIYDLIPIKFPQFFTASQIDLVTRVLKKIDAKKDFVACISESTRNDFLEFLGNKIDPKQVCVTPLAASENFYPVRDKNLIEATLSRYAIPSQSPYLLTLCTLEPRKNLKAVVSAFKRLVDGSKNLDLNLVLVGVKGWKNQDIFEEIAKTPGLESRIFFTGFIPDRDLSPIYSGAKAFIYPSLYEGFGLPPLEAMQCGVPVITSNTSSLPEVVGDAGIMVSPNDIDELCQAIHRVLEDNSLREALAVKSVQRSKEFSWAKCADETVQLYKKAVSSN
ncbi:glycosyltransferase family 1 protein [filamentous cyanobacterium CCT1]|nr:glycosyltransferase family 1 protein [filamentous cyanobacterium CCT1]PSN80774.1 glycosyltransferase family 1 protein [filamentous cyanobacterium CCP4]